MRSWVGSWTPLAVVALVAASAGYLSRPAIQAATEGLAVYGETVDRSMPWDPESCSLIASEVEVGGIVRRAGGRKAPYMEGARDRTEPGRYDKQIIREVADAWDGGQTGKAFYRACMQELWDHFKRQQQQKESGT